MKKTFAVKTFSLICLGYMGFQFLVLPAYLERQKMNSKENNKEQSTYLLFQNLYTSLRIPLFVLDLSSLNSTLPTHQIYEGLSRRKFIRYGIIKDTNLASTLEKYRLHFETIGLKLYATRSFHTELKTSVISHYFLCSQGFTVHVVMFYNKTRSTLWHGDVKWRSELTGSCLLDTEHFFKHAGLYDRFDIVRKGNLLLPSNPRQFLKHIKDSEYLECNYTRAHQFLMKYPQDVSEGSLKFQRNVRQIISRAKQYLDDLGVPFWLSSGTCLGWYRQCDVITYSHDVDFGVFITNYKPEIVSAFERGGFFLKHVFGKVNDSYELSFQAGDIKLDFFFFYEEKDHMWNGGTHHETGQKYKYIFPKFSMCWTIFLDLKVRVPCPPLPYIEANYGKNWMEPVKDWEWNKSPPNVRENGFWPKDEWNDVIQVY